MSRVGFFRNGIFALLALLACLPAYPQAVTNPLNGNINAQGTSCVGASCAWQKLPPGAGTSSITLSGTFSATLQFEISADNGNTWVSASTASSTSTGVTTFSVAGYTDVRVRCSAYVSGVVSATIFSSTGSSGGGSSGGTVTLAGNGGVSNGQWVTTSDVLWTQYTSPGSSANAYLSPLATATIFSSYRILQTNGTVTNGNWSTVTCAMTANGGYGVGIQVPVNGWLQSYTTYLNTAGVSNGSVYENLYILSSMPAGGSQNTCSVSLATANIGTLLAGAPAGSFYPVSFVGTTANIVSPWAIPGPSANQAISNPSAGAEFSATLGNQSRTCVTGLSFALATSATVANRVVSVRMIQPISTGTQLIYISSVAQPASTTVLYSFSPGTLAQQQNFGASIIQTVPFANGAPVCFTSSDIGTIGSLTQNIQTGDQYSSINLTITQLPDND